VVVVVVVVVIGGSVSFLATIVPNPIIVNAKSRSA